MRSIDSFSPYVLQQSDTNFALTMEKKQNLEREVFNIMQHVTGITYHLKQKWQEHCFLSKKKLSPSEHRKFVNIVFSLYMY